MEFFNVIINEAAAIFSAFYGIFNNIPWADLINTVIDLIPKM